MDFRDERTRVPKDVTGWQGGKRDERGNPSESNRRENGHAGWQCGRNGCVRGDPHVSRVRNRVQFCYFFRTVTRPLRRSKGIMSLGANIGPAKIIRFVWLSVVIWYAERIRPLAAAPLLGRSTLFLECDRFRFNSTWSIPGTGPVGLWLAKLISARLSFF